MNEVILGLHSRVRGLREVGPNSEVRTYRINPKTGKMERVEPAKQVKHGK